MAGAGYRRRGIRGRARLPVTWRRPAILSGERPGGRRKSSPAIRRSNGWSATCSTPTCGAGRSAGVRGVIHTAGWVSLGPDRPGDQPIDQRRADPAVARRGASRGCRAIRLHVDAVHAGGGHSRDNPPMNRPTGTSSGSTRRYTRTKREAERLVLEASGGGFTTIALCPGMVLGPRDPKPTSTQIVKGFSRTMIAVAPRGGIPIVDSRLLAIAHRRASSRADQGSAMPSSGRT